MAPLRPQASTRQGKKGPRSPLTDRRIRIDMGQGESEGQSAITIGDGSREKKYPRGFSAALYLVSERGADEPVITLARLLLSARKHLHYDIRIDRFTGSERRKQRGGRQGGGTVTRRAMRKRRHDDQPLTLLNRCF